jgi:peptidoglycan L-alanyl-D-glutamate endopeptidase CwlK
MSNKLDDLDLRFRSEVEDFIEAINQSADYKYIVIETLRTKEKQIALYAQGRKPLDEVNRLRGLANLPDITEAENQRIVTKTMNSKHLANADGYSEAFDIVAFDRRTGNVIWDDNERQRIVPYLVAYEKSKAYPHLKAGYEWKKWQDKAHYELKT